MPQSQPRNSITILEAVELIRRAGRGATTHELTAFLADCINGIIDGSPESLARRVIQEKQEKESRIDDSLIGSGREDQQISETQQDYADSRSPDNFLQGADE